LNTTAPLVGVVVVGVVVVVVVVVAEVVVGVGVVVVVAVGDVEVVVPAEVVVVPGRVVVVPDEVVVVVETGVVAVVPVGGGAGDVTTEVASDVATADPFLLVAVTTTRSVDPRSLVATVYVCRFAPGVGEQSRPLLLQRAHW
jgi:hypothetical protein